MIENACFALAILSVLLVPGYVLYVFSRLFFKATMEHIAEAPLRAAYAARRGTPVKPSPSERSPRAKKIFSVIGHTIGYAILSVIGILVFGFHTFWVILAIMWFMSDFKKMVAEEVLEGLKTQSPK